MEYLEFGDLRNYLNDSPPLLEKDAGYITFQILEGLTYMHENRFAHRDLKPAVGFLRLRYLVRVSKANLCPRIYC